MFADDYTLLGIGVIYLLFCFLVGRYSESKGFSFARGFFLGLLISPIFGAIAIGFFKSAKK